MPFSRDYASNARALAEQRTGFNPYHRPVDPDHPDMQASTLKRLLRGEITAAEATVEARRVADAHRGFNDRLRQDADIGFVAPAEDVLAGQRDGSVPRVRDARTGKYVDLAEVAREAGHQPAPGMLPPKPAA